MLGQEILHILQLAGTCLQWCKQSKGGGSDTKQFRRTWSSAYLGCSTVSTHLTWHQHDGTRGQPPKQANKAQAQLVIQGTHRMRHTLVRCKLCIHPKVDQLGMARTTILVRHLRGVRVYGVCAWHLRWASQWHRGIRLGGTSSGFAQAPGPGYEGSDGIYISHLVACHLT